MSRTNTDGTERQSEGRREPDRIVGVYSVHATKKLLDRMKELVEDPVAEPTTNLGNWYAKPLFWKPQYALFVNERTFLPVLVPLAPAATLLRRFPGILATTLEAHGIPQSFTDTEIAAMESVGLSKTQSRQLVGVMNEQAFHADYMRRDEGDGDELAIAVELSRMPIGILRKSYRFPDQALADLVSDVTGASIERKTSTREYDRPDAITHNLFSRPEKD